MRWIQLFLGVLLVLAAFPAALAGMVLAGSASFHYQLPQNLVFVPLLLIAVVPATSLILLGGMLAGRGWRGIRRAKPVEATG